MFLTNLSVTELEYRSKKKNEEAQANLSTLSARL